jgi:hypothetical protein
MEYKSRTVEVGKEYRDAELGDERLERRLEKVVDRVAARPSASFPLALVTEAELEAFYRFVNNEKVKAAALLAPHKEATRKRVSQDNAVLVVHDTTEFRYGGDRAELGRLQESGRGYLGHFALAVSASERHDALGVLGVHAWRRLGETPTAKRKAGKLSYTESRKLAGEEHRWQRMVNEVEELVADLDQRVVHVLDSESDDYGLLARFVQGSHGFVLRAAYDRVLYRQTPFMPRLKMKEAVSETRVVAKRTVKLSRRRRRPGGGRKRDRVRDERVAKLAIRANAVTLKRPSYQEDSPPILDVNVVMVSEVGAPAGADPVEWVLLTTEPIHTREQILRVVDAYRGRWVIEEYFKALKTGCAIEKRQADNWNSMQNVLALLTPIAWNLLRLRTLSRTDSSASATAVLTKLQLKILRAASETKLRGRVSIREAMLAIARLGGHLRSNGDPGWLVLGRGYQELLMLEAGYRLALAPRGAPKDM